MVEVEGPQPPPQLFPTSNWESFPLPPQLGYYKKDISKNRLFKTYISVFVACKKIAKGSVLETMTLEFVTWKLKIDPIEKERTRIFQITLW